MGGFSAKEGRQKFGYAPHQGCVKALHCNKIGRLVSGGADHSAKLFDLKLGVELVSLQEHDDTVNCVEFWRTTTLVTGSNDGYVCIWRCHDWEMLFKFHAHKSAVVSVAVHPSGRIMASCGRDLSLRLWDLTRGTSAAHLSIDTVAEALEWSPSGNHIAVLSARELSVLDAKTGDLATFSDSSVGTFLHVPLTALLFLTDELVVLGDGKGELRILRFTPGTSTLQVVCSLPAEGNRARIKAMTRTTEDDAGVVFVVGTSSGVVEIWRFTAVDGTATDTSTFKQLLEVNTGARLTSMAAWMEDAVETKASKRMRMRHRKAAEKSAVTAATGVKPRKKTQVRKQNQKGGRRNK